jgi:integral membrane protein
VSDSTEETVDEGTGAAGFVHAFVPIIPAVGVLLILLMLVAVPMKYIGHDDRWVTWFGVPHGWLYMLLILSAIDLGRRVKWSIRGVIGIALAGTVPFLSFVAEYIARKDVYRRIANSNPVSMQ